MLGRLALVLGAFVLISIGARATHLGGASPRHLTGAQLLESREAVAQVTVSGTILDRKPTTNGLMVIIRTHDGQEVNVIVTDEARSGPLMLGSNYKFTGQTLSPGTISVSTPNSVTQTRGELRSRRMVLQVWNGVGYASGPYGTATISAPDVPNGTHELVVISSEGGKTWAQLP